MATADRPAADDVVAPFETVTTPCPVPSPDMKYVTQAPVRLVYVAGPMRLGNPNQNVATALNAGMDLMRAGWVPFLPQLSNLWETVAGSPDPDHEDGASGWLELDFKIISRCDALVRLPGKSSGADREVALALTLGIPVLTLYDAMVVASHPSFSQPGAKIPRPEEIYA